MIALPRPAAATTARFAPVEFTLLDARIDNISRRSALSRILANRPSSAARLVYFANAHCLNMASVDPAYRRALQAADMVLPDGTGVRWGAAMHGWQVRENLNGTDLFPELCAWAAQRGLSLYLLGGQEGVASAAAQAMQERYSNLKIAGCRDGYFSDTQAASVVEAVNASGADLLLVGLGVPRQELWLREHAQTLQVRSALAVGGLFDYYSGRIPRAPAWLRACGQEWVWRLLQEPARLARRYLLGNPQFLWRVWRSQSPRLPAWQQSRWSAWLQQRYCQWQAGAPRRQAALQRAMDVSLVLPALVLLAPLFLMLAAWVRLDSKGPALFWQWRVGDAGRRFRFYKFRSMYVDAEQRRQALEARNEMSGGVLFKMRDDPRITRSGRLLRRLSLDELPQLWNVLRGDMSLVGPRPALPQEVAQYRSADRQRLMGKPGITCFWQVNGRSDIPFDQQVQLDRKFLQQPSLKAYLSLLLRTIPAVLSGRGAY